VSRSVALACALALSLSATVNCDSRETQTIRLQNGDSGRSVTAAVGDTIEITLQTIGPGQYGNPSVSSPSVRFLGESAAEPANPGGARQLYRFEAASTGRADITIGHTDELPAAPATPPFVIAVGVQ
jgi:hypothetical protein